VRVSGWTVTSIFGFAPNAPQAPLELSHRRLGPISRIAARMPIGAEWAWFKTCQFQVTPETDRALMVKGFLVLGVTLI
jgi:hypothetical protein